jgi:glyoxylase-like metal-dependent hydrolase (beta-lactamase superfamily II)
VISDGKAPPKPAQAGFGVSGIIDHPDGISAVDTQHLGPMLDASHLIVDDGRVAFVDTGTGLSVPHLLAALEAKQLGVEAVDWVLLTHIHLDHAGGAGVLLRSLPKARVVVHPRGARHLADPSRLIGATVDVYGAEFFARQYGEVAPVPSDRIVTTEEGMVLPLGRRSLRFLHTPGHATHHCSIWDEAATAIFTGDTFGVSYRDFDVNGRAFVLPTTSPSHFDADDMRRSIDRIAGLGASAAYLTHYSRIEELSGHALELHAALDAYVDIAKRFRSAREREPLMRAAMFEWLSAALDAHGDPHDADYRQAKLELDIELNVQGLMHWADSLAH